MNRKKIKYGKRSRRQAARRGQSYLPLWITLGGILLVGAALFALWKTQQPAKEAAPVQVSGQPSLKVDRDFVDFGDVPLGEVISVSFNVANVGDQTLNFKAKPYVEVLEGC